MSVEKEVKQKMGENTIQYKQRQQYFSLSLDIISLYKDYCNLTILITVECFLLTSHCDNLGECNLALVRPLSFRS